jgi:hypothetical protein
LIYAYHWTPAQVLDMTLPELWWAYDETVKWRQAEADAINNPTNGGA